MNNRTERRFEPGRAPARWMSARVIAALLAVLGVIAGVGPTASPASAQSDAPIVVFSGHGWGHGRGMGQWGAQGYALEQGWDAEQILSHFYGNTTAGSVATAISPIEPAIDPDSVRVEIRDQRSNTMRARVEVGEMHIVNPADGEILGLVTQGQTVHIAVNGSGGLTYRISSSCTDSNWIFVQERADLTAIDVRSIATDDAHRGLLELCKPNGSSNWYEGVLRANNVGGETRTVNIVPIETYLRGVVPREVPASWDSDALEAQAVAARSYAMAGDTRQQPYADTCDTILCQVYQGRYQRNAGQTSDPELATHPNTDAAIAATEGHVRVYADGTIARTEFSASTGGYTVGGDFPAVEDLGDSTAANPRHDWDIVVDLTSYENNAGLGQLLEVRVPERNGLGEDGGRVLTVEFVFERGATSMTGNEARRAFGLHSDWFTPGPVSSSGATGADADYVDAMYQLFLGRSASVAERVEWADDVEAGNRRALTDELSTSREWAGVVIDGIYESALGRGADDAGLSFWIGEISAGVRIEVIGAQFYGSPEYFDRVGGTNEAFVRSLYRELLDRDADDAGLEFWGGQLERGEVTTGDVASGFYMSVESRRSRVTGLYQQILGRSPDESGLAFWAEQLLVTDDLVLASDLAVSDESYQRAIGG